MIIAVVTCRKYRDCLLPFFSLFRKFWQTCPYKVWLVTDSHDTGPIPDKDCRVHCAGESKSWCEVVASFAASTKENICVFQEDFLINAPVNELLIVNGLQQLEERKAAMVRIYPCPGGDIPYGDKWYAGIPKGTRYRVSCMASIWDPRILAEIASKCGETPFDFEITGSKLSNDYREPFIAFRRDVQPWPISYICSAISRGKWEPHALEFCRQQGVEVDTSMREVALS